MFTHVNDHGLKDLESITHANGKRFYKTPEGIWYPSITTMLGLKEKPELTAWRKRLGDEEADKQTKDAADRGSDVHELAECYLNNEPPPKMIETKHIGLFHKLKPRLNKIDNIRAQEVALYSDKLELAGRVDCIGEYDNVLSIIDFKTSIRDKLKEWIEDYFLQATAYAIMWHERTGESIENIVILIASEKGLVANVFKENIAKYVATLLKRIKESKHDLERPNY